MKFDLRSDSQRHKHFVGLFNVPGQTPTRGQHFYTINGLFRETAPFSRLLRHARDTEDALYILDLTPGSPRGKTQSGFRKSQSHANTFT